MHDDPMIFALKDRVSRYILSLIDDNHNVTRKLASMNRRYHSWGRYPPSEQSAVALHWRTLPLPIPADSHEDISAFRQRPLIRRRLPQ